MNKVYEVTRENFFISTDMAKLNVEMIHHFLSTQSYWAQDIPLAVVQKAIEHSLCFGLYDNDVQVGFARLITDTATFAYLADVFILPEQRGKGLSKWLVEIILAHPGLQGIRGWVLRTKDAHGLYEQYGFKKLTDESANRYMQKHNPDAYKNML